MGRIVISTLGSRGDLHPMLPVADALRKLGHEVLFAVSSGLADAVKSEGYPVRSISMPASSVGYSQTQSASRTRVAEVFPAYVKNAMETIRSACSDADVLITHPHQLAATVVARELGMRWVTLTVYPGLIPSAYTVPQPHWLPALGTPAGRLVNKLTWRVFDIGIRHLYGDIVDSALAANGVSGMETRPTLAGLSPDLTIVLSSPRYSPPQPDWPPSVKVVGYVGWDEPRVWRNPPEVDRFLSEGAPPVLVTTSSADERDPVSFFKTALDALAAARMRGILLLGSAAEQIKTQPDGSVAKDVAAWPYLPLSRILPHSAFAVHHGGIGTTLTTLRYGRACVAIPAAYDQWYNAGRIKALGVGRVLKLKDLTPERLAMEMETVASTQRYAQRSRELGEAMGSEDGTTAAAKEIEALLQSG